MTDPAASPNSSQQDLTGQLVADEFQVMRRLGVGGGGQVYLAVQQSLDRKVALKILHVERAPNHKAAQRFEVEAKAVARATHANIVQVYAFGEWHGHRYVALEYVEGLNLQEFLEKKGPPELLLTLSIMRQVTAALQRASELGITHRDIKPENILLTRKNEVKVTDFGLARDQTQQTKLTQTGMAMGTPLYMSPEQVEGKEVDPRSDIYSFGVTCYFLLTGAPPFEGSNAFEVAWRHVQEPPPSLDDARPDIPPELCTIIHRMMEKAPEDRYQTARELQQALENLQNKIGGITNDAPGTADDAVTTPKQKAASKPKVVAQLSADPPSVPTRGFPWALVLTAMVSLLVGGALAWKREQKKDAERPLAPVEQRVTLDQREKELKEQVERYLSWAEGYRTVRSGMGQCIELALLYLNEPNYGQALALFRRMEKAGSGLKPLPAEMRDYQAFGTLGQAIVLSKMGEHEKSAELFRQMAQGVNGRPWASRNRWAKYLQGNRELLWHLLDAWERDKDAKTQVPQIPALLFRGPRAVQPMNPKR